MVRLRTGAGELRVALARGWARASDGRALAPGDLIERSGDGAWHIAHRPDPAHLGRGDSEVARLSGARLRGLRVRASALAAIRRFFDGRGFLEVETPVLVRSPGLEVHLDAVPAGVGRWLITSPEYQMKRLMAAGLERIYTVCKCFRAGEEGHHHSAEFTMLEWYRAWADWTEILADTEALVAEVALAVRGTCTVEVDGRVIDVTPPWPRMTVADAMQRFAGVRVRGDEDAAELADRVRAAGIDVGTATAWDDLFFAAFLDRVEPALAALARPVVLMDWPVPLAALAQRKPGAPHVAERFEAYLGGVELCNAFGELVDAAEQRARFAAERAERAERGRASYPVDERFLAALDEGLPPSAGIALGVDRLIMLVAGAAHIREVLAFTADEL
ncbi:EF-P lysine aminoacylase EpmA [Haliangium sp.]|uniref:EF-P lysine aminoacylase EpmA n=1 Tax=Haliangium sp. TaxID=2663208 RepID=UPI003D0B6C55